MVCNVIDNCRCYAYSDGSDPKATQFCGVRRGSKVLPCPADCCAGGCPGQVSGIGPRQPFRIIDRENDSVIRNHTPFLILIAITLVLALIFMT